MYNVNYEASGEGGLLRPQCVLVRFRGVTARVDRGRSRHAARVAGPLRLACRSAIAAADRLEAELTGGLSSSAVEDVQQRVDRALWGA